jgi:hypothetical protein
MWNWTPSDSYSRTLLAHRGDCDAVLHREIKRIVRGIRYKRALKPYVDALRFVVVVLNDCKEMVVTYGRHWKASKKVDSGANPVAGASSGFQASNFTGSQNVALGANALALAVGGTSNHTFPPASADESVTHAGIRAGEIAAYRGWLLHQDGFLRSVYRSETIWKPGEVVEGNPELSGEGVHAFKSVFDMATYCGVSNRVACSMVSGKVHLWGEVVEHERGYRGQFASIAVIDDSPHYDAEALRKLYGLVPKRKRSKIRG